MAGGYVEEYYENENDRCFSGILIPGIQLLPNSLLAVVYFLFLAYLFLGISIVADIFMEAIEVITSKMVVTTIQDKDGKQYQIEVPFWNATLANLTLMALGSSAPEILLSVIETLQTLGQPAGELGPSTIVGSAAFNLLVISGVSIIAVEEPKKIKDMGVFTCTGVFSMFAYIWLYVCLQDDEISIGEAWWTLIFFFILCALAFMADKWNERKEKRLQSQAEIEADNKLNEHRINKSKIRILAKTYGEKSVIQIGMGQKPDMLIPEKDRFDVLFCFKSLLDKQDLSGVDAKTFSELLQPDSLLERFAAKKANKVGGDKDFVNMKGV